MKMYWTFVAIAVVCLFDRCDSQTVTTTDLDTTTAEAATVMETATTPEPTTTTTIPILSAVTDLKIEHLMDLNYSVSWKHDAPAGVVVSYSVTLPDVMGLPISTFELMTNIEFPTSATLYRVSVVALAPSYQGSPPAEGEIVTVPQLDGDLNVTNDTVSGTFMAPETGVSIQATAASPVVVVTGAQFVASSLESATSYTLSFKAAVDGNQGLSSAVIQVNATTQENLPLFQRGDFGIVPDRRSVRVNWTSDAFTDIFYITVSTTSSECVASATFNCSNCGPKPTSPVDAVSCLAASTSTYAADEEITAVLESLQPVTNYNLTITAESQLGTITPVAGIIFLTLEDVPETPPTNFSLGNATYEGMGAIAYNTKQEVLAEWGPPQIPNGVITQYVLRVESPKHTFNQTVVSGYQATLQRLEAYTNYSVSIVAQNAVGTGPSTTLYVVTLETVPSAPLNISVVPTLAAANVTWQPPELSNGVLLTYTARIRFAINCSSVDGIDPITVEASMPRLVSFEGLLSGVNYEVILVANTSIGGGEEAVYAFGTSQGPSVPRNIVVVTLPSDRAARVTWDEPSSPNDAPTNLVYEVDVVSGETEPLRVCSGLEVVDRNCLINFFLLNASVNYQIKVTGSNSHDTGQPGYSNPFSLAAELVTSDAFNLPQAQEPTTSTISFALPAEWEENLFEPPSGGAKIELQRIDILVVASSSKPEPAFGSASAVRATSTWKVANDNDFMSQYVALSLNTGDSSARKRRSTSGKIIVIGDDTSCNGDCNGPLRDNIRYCVSLRGFTDTNYLDTGCVYEATTVQNLVPIIVPVVVVIIVVVIVSFIILYLWYKKVITLESCKKTQEVEHVKPAPTPPAQTAPAKSSEPVKIREFHAHVDKMHRDSNFMFAEEYRMLRDASPRPSQQLASMPYNNPKNRYVDILPFDHSRVKLKATDEDGTMDYINANYMPGYNSKREFIAAQGPLPGTIDDFWRMVWEQNVTTVVMLTNLVEKGKRKCEQYWPEKVEEHSAYGDLVVTMRSESNLPEYIIRLFDIEMGDQRRTVKQFFYTKWPDWGCPDTPHTLLNFVSVVRSHIRPDSTGPIVVHCSAGVGRTGTFVTVDRMMQHMRTHDVMDVYGTVREMRGYRCRMVQTEDQYIYVHDCLIAALNQGMSPYYTPPDREDSEDDEEADYMNTMKDEPDYVNLQSMGPRNSVRKESHNGGISPGSVQMTMVAEDSDSEQEEDDQL